MKHLNLGSPIAVVSELATDIDAYEAGAIDRINGAPQDPGPAVRAMGMHGIDEYIRGWNDGGHYEEEEVHQYAERMQQRWGQPRREE